MLVNVEFAYEQTWQRKSAGVVFSFYPNSVTEVEIKEPSADEFPLVAIVRQLEGEDTENVEIRSRALRYLDEKFWLETDIPIDELSERLTYRIPYKAFPQTPDDPTDPDVQFLVNTRENIVEKIHFLAEDYIIFEGKVWQPTPEPMYNVKLLHGNTLTMKVVFDDVVQPGDFSALERREAIRFGEEIYARQHGTLEGLVYDIPDQIYVCSPDHFKRFPSAAKEDAVEEMQYKQNMVCEMSYLFGYYMAEDVLKDSTVPCSLDNFKERVGAWAEDFIEEDPEMLSIDDFLCGKLVEIGWKDLVRCTDNTEIWYTYRDASNYKLHTTVVIPGVVSDDQEKTIRDCLIDGECFLPAQVGLPDDNRYSGTEDDHSYFELNSFESVNKPVTKGFENLTPENLVERFLKAKDNWDESSFA